MRLHPGDRISWRDEEHLVVTVHTGCVALRSKVDGEDIEVLSADFSGAAEPARGFTAVDALLELRGLDELDPTDRLALDV